MIERLLLDQLVMSYLVEREVWEGGGAGISLDGGRQRRAIIPRVRKITNRWTVRKSAFDWRSLTA
jgi:hypothetical protein